MGKPKKGTKKKDKDDWEDDVLNELEELKEGGAAASNESVKMSHKPKNAAAVNKFNLLDDESGSEEDSAPVASQKTKKSTKNKDFIDNASNEMENDITNHVHEINTATESNSKHKQSEEVHSGDDDLDLPSVTSKKSKKKKKGKDIDIDDLAIDEDELQNNGALDTEMGASKSVKEHKAAKTETKQEDEEDSGPTVKTAAQKRAEKKEREKKKKEAEKAKAKAKVKKVEEVKEGGHKEVDKVEQESPQTPTTAIEGKTEALKMKENENDIVEPQGDGEGDDDAEGEGDKKKKKKKKKKVAEKEEKKTKKPNKALVKQMQQQLEQLKLEEERVKREEEEKLRALEEAENRRLEKLRLEQEKKDKKKQKEKERKERLKKEGKLLTKAQKQQRAQQQAQLEALKQQGIEIPALMRAQLEQDVAPVKKPVRYGSKKPKQKQQQQQQQQEEEERQESTEQQEPEASSEVDKEKPESTVDEAETENQIEEELEDDSKEEVKDAWDIESDEEEGGSSEAAPEGEQDKERPASKSDDADEESDEESESEESEDESESSEEEEESDEEEAKTVPEQRKETVEERIQRRQAEAEAQKSTDKLRSPVVCVLGHVDTGKTKILDKIRHSHVQDGEAGGITQQIGATMVPVYAIKEQTKMVKEFADFEMKLPGLLIIDTPGHESFSNLRSRGSSLCDMAILVVDIMHGLEPQTIESINLLKKRKTPFIVALNKVDRLFEWKRGPNSSIIDTIKKQKRNTKQEFEERVQITINEFAEQGLNATLFYNNKDTRSYVSLVPTSAHTGDGMGDLISQIVTLTQGRMAQKLAFSEDLDCMVLEVKALPGLGTTIDVILVNGTLREGDTIVLAGIEGPIVAQVRALLMPQPLKELRVKNQYVTHKEVVGAQGVKIAAKDLEKALAGISLYVPQQPDEIEYFKDEVASALSSTLKAIQLSERGVYVQASTLGSLEALLEFLKTSKIPYAGVNIGPVHRRDIMKCSIMLEHDSQYAVVLAFDVRVERDAQEMADQMGVKIFAADIIYHLFDKFTAYREELKMKKREEFRHIAIFPCKLRVLPQHIFNSRDPIVMGVMVEGGIVKEGTPITIPSKSFTDIGIVTGLEANHKPLESARKGMEVCIKIEPTPGDTPKLYGRHFDHTDLLVSKISRQSIDAVKDYFRDDMQKNDWQLMIELKKMFEIL